MITLNFTSDNPSDDLSAIVQVLNISHRRQRILDLQRIIIQPKTHLDCF